MRSASLVLVVALALCSSAPAQVLTGKKPVVPLPNRNIKDRLSPEEQKKHFQVPEGFEVDVSSAAPEHERLPTKTPA
jgi:hypothetical protein